MNSPSLLAVAAAMAAASPAHAYQATPFPLPLAADLQAIAVTDFATKEEIDAAAKNLATVRIREGTREDVRAAEAFEDALPAIVDLSAEADPVSLDDADLADARGGEAVVLTRQTLIAITTGNTIHGNYTAGDIRLSDNALSSFTGLGNVLMNTGAQNSLQAGMNVTINLTD